MAKQNAATHPDGGVVRIGGRDFALVPLDEFRALQERAGDFSPEEDEADRAIVRAHREAVAKDDVLRIPAAVVDEMLDGASVVGPLRRWRGLTQDELAAKADIGQGYLSQIESGDRKISLTAARKLARAMDLPLSTLIDE
jgi:DNA-binding XRE family transcriptional regulator